MKNTMSSNKPRLLVLTDIGGDPDDEQSLVRLLMYSNEFDIVGIIPEHWLNHSGRHGDLSPAGQMDLVRDMISLYGRVRGNLLKHASDYPDAEKAVTGEIKLGEGPAVARGANINPIPTNSLTR